MRKCTLALLGLLGCVDDSLEPLRCETGPLEIPITRQGSDGGFYAPLEDAWFAGVDGVRTPCPRTSYGIDCKVPGVGSYTFGARAEDRELSVQHEVVQGELCGVGRVVLNDDCAPEQLTTVRGTLAWREGEPVSDDVAVWVQVQQETWSTSFDCARDGSAYRCPAWNGRPGEYTVAARIGPSTLAKTFAVSIAKCAVTPVQLDFVRESWPCSDARQLELAVVVRTPGGMAGPDALRIRALNGEPRPCTLVPDAALHATNVICPLIDRPRDGMYELELTSGARTEKVTYWVTDDGCRNKGWLTWSLEDAQTCVGKVGTPNRCGAPGSTLSLLDECRMYPTNERSVRGPVCPRP